MADDPRFIRFFVPDMMRKRVREWGMNEFSRRYHSAYQDYAAFSRKWLRVVTHAGPAAVERVYQQVAQNNVRPEEGHVLSLWSAPSFSKLDTNGTPVSYYSGS